MHFFSPRRCMVRSICTLVILAVAISTIRAQEEISPAAKKKLAANSLQQQEGEEGVETGLLGVDDDRAKSIAEMRALWTKVKAGDSQAQYALGIKALRGQGFPKSTKQGIYLLSRAADQDHPDALMDLMLNYASRVGFPPDWEESRAALDEKFDRMVVYFRNPKISPYKKALLFEAYVVAYKIAAPKEDRKIIFEKLREHFVKEFPDSGILHYTDGAFYVEYAWDARTSKWAYEVTPEQFKEFGNLLVFAKHALEKSYEMDPNNFMAAAKMITVMMGMSRPRDEMETWFERAIKANPKYLKPYFAKMSYLEPKWLGSAEEMIEFGRECVKKGQWDTNIPMQLVMAHERLAAYLPKKEWKPNTAPEYPYFEKAGVWEDIRLVYDGYLKADPSNHTARSKFARFACMCKKWSVAKEQFGILGPKVDQSAFLVPAEYEAFKELANR